MPGPVACAGCRHAEHFTNECLGYYGDCPCTGRGARPDRGTREQLVHPAPYGGADDPYEATRVIEAWGLGYCLGNAVRYIARAGRKPGADAPADLCKAAWYLDLAIVRMERGGRGAPYRPGDGADG